MDTPRQPSSVRNILDWIIVIGLGLTLGHTAWWIGGMRPEVKLEIVWMLGGLLCLHCIAMLYTAFRSHVRLSWDAMTYVPFIAYIGFSLLFITPVPWLAKREWLLFTQAFMVCWLVTHHARSGRKMVVLGIFIGLIGLMEVGAACYQYYYKPYWLPMGLKLPIYEGRSSGTLGSPNHFAALMLMLFLPCILGVFWQTFSARTRLYSFIGTCMFGLGLVLASSRGAFVSLVFTLLVLPFFVTRSYSKRWIALATILLMLFIGYWGLYSNMTLFKTRADYSFDAHSFGSRRIMWAGAWEIFKEHKLWGSGAASYNEAFEDFRPPHFNLNPEYAHNEALNILSDYGLVGFLFLFGCVAWVLLKGFRSWLHISFGEEDRRLLARKYGLAAVGLGIVAFGIHSMGDFLFRVPIVLFVASVYIGLCIRLMNRRAYISLPRLLFAVLYGILGVAAVTVFPNWAEKLYKSDTHYQTAEYKLHVYLDRPQILNNNPYQLFEIIHSAQQAKKFDNKNPDIDSLLSRAYYHQAIDWDAERERHISLAVEHAAKAVLRNEQNWRYWVSYGLALWLKGEIQQSGTCLASAIDLAPNNAQAWYYYAYYLSLDDARPDLALEAAKKAEWLNPLNSKAVQLRRDLEYRFF